MTQITEYFSFGDFNSKTEGFYILEHDAPSPDEKEIIEDIPYMQGVYDFSMLLGERVFENRTVTFKIAKFMAPYADRKKAAQDTKNKLMLNGILPVADSYLDSCHWLGKCKSVDPDDDQERNKLTLTVVFDCYPFAIRNATSYSDEFDVDYFTDGVDAWTGFHVVSYRKILLFNTGNTRISPTAVASKKMTLKSGGASIQLLPGENKDFFFKLEIGVNEIELIGTGHVSFYVEQEVMA